MEEDKLIEEDKKIKDHARMFLNMHKEMTKLKEDIMTASLHSISPPRITLKRNCKGQVGWEIATSEAETLFELINEIKKVDTILLRDFRTRKKGGSVVNTQKRGGND